MKLLQIADAASSSPAVVFRLVLACAISVHLRLALDTAEQGLEASPSGQCARNAM
ncbi:MAG: hypothetical protein JNN30_16730 [Rhodanobacteraceae bacterium]|nr:hypothetical protein [Rhodanobacteraceae bacterium]